MGLEEQYFHDPAVSVILLPNTKNPKSKQKTHFNNTELTQIFSLRPDQPVLQPLDLITQTWHDKQIAFIQSFLPFLKLKPHSHRGVYVILISVIHLSFISPLNCSNYPSQSPSDPLLTGSHLSALHCISHRATVSQLLSSTEVLDSYTASIRDSSLPLVLQGFLPHWEPFQGQPVLLCRDGEALPAGNCDAWSVLPSRTNHQANWCFLFKSDYIFLTD